MQKKNEINYSEVLVTYRKKAGLTQQQVAEALEIKRPTYAKYEKDVTPPLEILFKLSSLLNFPIEILNYAKGKNSSVNYVELYRSQASKQTKLKVASDEPPPVPKYIKSLDNVEYFLPTENEKQFILLLRQLDSKSKKEFMDSIKKYFDKN